jgi:very-short-patch-repair endonuclease
VPRAKSKPEERLWELVCERYPDAKREVGSLVPGRKYKADIVIERLKLVIEVDGWEFHGKYKSGFLRDRQKDRLLMLAGYRVVRFTAGEILKESSVVMETLDKVINVVEQERRRTNGKAACK